MFFNIFKPKQKTRIDEVIDLLSKQDKTYRKFVADKVSELLKSDDIVAKHLQFIVNSDQKLPKDYMFATCSGGFVINAEKAVNIACQLRVVSDAIGNEYYSRNYDINKAEHGFLGGGRSRAKVPPKPVYRLTKRTIKTKDGKVRAVYCKDGKDYVKRISATTGKVMYKLV